MSALWANIPQSIKEHKAWVGWRYIIKDNKEKPTKVPFHLCSGRPASVNDPDTWCHWVDVEKHGANFDGVGFVFSDNDPFFFVDFDATTVQDNLDTQMRIYNIIETYAERSPSGNGAHLIGLGKFEGRGRKTGDIELYCRQRFATFTGDVLRNVEPQPTEHLSILYQQMTKHEDIPVYEPDGPERYSDDEIITRAMNASNGYKFNELWNGRWGEWYPTNSQNEADYALIDMLSFYTEHRGQTHRLFMQSQLGQRDKARTHKTYVHNMITGSFDRLMPPPDPDMFREWAAVIEQSGVSEADGDTTPTPESAPEGAVQPTNAAIEPLALKAKNVYTRPPGLVGDIAQFILDQAPRPVPEIAIAGAIGFMAGICGQQYNISNEGLNYYILVLARSGRGKEAMRQGINKIIKAVDNNNHGSQLAAKFIGPGDMASSQGLVRHLAGEGNSKSIVSILGEFGLKLQQLADPRANGTEKMLQKLILEIYHMSGPPGLLMPTVYSDAVKNLAPINSPAFSIIAETTFERFRVDEILINDGLIPRFSIIEYKGPLVPFNENAHLALVPQHIIQEVSSLCANALACQKDNRSKIVDQTDDAKKLFKEFNKFIEARVNRDDIREAFTNVWNRSHIRAMKLAALVAVGINKFDPCVTADVAQWAIDFVKNDGRILHEGLEGGGMGHFATESVETECLNELMKRIAIYLIEPFKPSSNKAAKQEEHAAKRFRASYVQTFISRNKRFFDREGKTTKALNETLQMLCDYGYIKVLAQNAAKTYEVTDMDAFEDAYAKYTRGKVA